MLIQLDAGTIKKITTLSRKTKLKPPSKFTTGSSSRDP